MSTFVNNDVSSGNVVYASDHNTQGALLAAVLNGGIDNSNIAAGAAIATSKLASDGFLGAWTAWVPTISASGGGAPAIGNGTMVARYQQTGKTVDCFFKITLGTTTNFGTGILQFSLPVTAHASWVAPAFIGTAHFENTGVAPYGGWVSLASSTQFQFAAHDTAGDGLIVYVSGSGGIPFGFGNGDIVEGTFRYEAA